MSTPTGDVPRRRKPKLLLCSRCLSPLYAEPHRAKVGDHCERSVPAEFYRDASGTVLLRRVCGGKLEVA